MVKILDRGHVGEIYPVSMAALLSYSRSEWELDEQDSKK